MRQPLQSFHREENVGVDLLCAWNGCYNSPAGVIRAFPF